jgi:hypothetical protein
MSVLRPTTSSASMVSVGSTDRAEGAGRLTRAWLSTPSCWKHLGRR